MFILYLNYKTTKPLNLPHKHTYSFDEKTNVLVLKTVGIVTLENSIEFMTEVVTHRHFPNDILVLQDHSEAELKISMTEIHVLEAFQRKYIDNFNTVKLAILLPKNAEQAMFSLYYQGIINNENCESKVFDSQEQAKLWLTKK